MPNRHLVRVWHSGLPACKSFRAVGASLSFRLFRLKKGASRIRIGFWGILYYNYTKVAPHNGIGNYVGPYYIKLLDSDLIAEVGCHLGY